MQTPIWLSCRVPSYREFGEIALEHIASLGIHWVEIRCPAPEDLTPRLDELSRFNLQAATMQGRLDLTRDDIADQLEPLWPVFARFKCSRMLLATLPLDLPKDVQYGRLRTAAECAAEAGVTILLETHPDLATHGDDSKATLAAVDHPALKINFDPANIYFYNQKRDAVRELEAIAPHVGGVHLKETNGQYNQWHFPALGTGIVDFAGVFRVLDQAGYDGPYTLEIEGIEGEVRSERLITSRVAESVGYLRGLGRL
jgi:hypothetical protein